MTSTTPWIPVALSSSIEAGTSAGTKVNGEERVVWRDAAGKPHVWEDRCPHRGMRMSFGFVRGDHIACLYHGWRYDTAGQCRHIPAHPDLEVPKTIKVPTFAAMERAGIVWMAPEDADAADLPALPEDASPVRSLYLDLPAEKAAEAVMTGPPQGWQPERRADGTLALNGDGMMAILAVQPRDDSSTALHVTVAGEVASGARRALALWLTDLRNRVETVKTEAV